MAAPEHDVGESLRFLAPGLLHLLGNALFRVQGHAGMLTGGEVDAAREGRAIREAADKAADVLQLLRWLVGEPGVGAVQAGMLLQRLGESLRVPLRERGLRLRVLHSSRQTPSLVDARGLLRGVLAALRSLCQQAPEGCGGVAVLDLVAQEPERARIRMTIEPDPARLPFPLDGRICAARAREDLGGAGVEVVPLPDASGLWVEVPCLDGERSLS